MAATSLVARNFLYNDVISIPTCNALHILCALYKGIETQHMYNPCPRPGFPSRSKRMLAVSGHKNHSSFNVLDGSARRAWSTPLQRTGLGRPCFSSPGFVDPASGRWAWSTLLQLARLHRPRFRSTGLVDAASARRASSTLLQLAGLGRPHDHPTLSWATI